MSILIPDLKRAVEFLTRYPKLETSGDLGKSVEGLKSALERFLDKAGELEVEQLPGYSEVAALLDGDAKATANVRFMKDFSREEMRTEFQALKADKATRKRFLQLVAKQGKLMRLKDRLDPRKKFRDLLDALISKDLESIRARLINMSAKDLTGLVHANGFDAPKTATGMVSKSKKSLDQIMSQIKQMKRSEHY